MKLIKPEHIGTIIRDENEGFWADIETHEVNIGNIDSGLRNLIEELRDIYQDEMPIEVEDKDKDKEAISYLQARCPESLFVLEGNVFIFPQKIRELIQPGIDGIHAAETLERIKHIIEKTQSRKRCGLRNLGPKI